MCWGQKQSPYFKVLPSHFDLGKCSSIASLRAQEQGHEKLKTSFILLQPGVAFVANYLYFLKKKKCCVSDSGVIYQHCNNSTVFIPLSHLQMYYHPLYYHHLPVYFNYHDYSELSSVVNCKLLLSSTTYTSSFFHSQLIPLVVCGFYQKYFKYIQTQYLCLYRDNMIQIELYTAFFLCHKR